MTFCAIFPGHGSQSVGMLAGLAEQDEIVRQTFDQSSEALGYDLWQLTQEGPEETLGETERTQPAMLAAGVAVYRAWRDAGGPVPAAMAGHSLGEYTALVCAGRLGLGEAVVLAQRRGREMQRAVPAGQGAMAAILGLDDEQVAAACREASRGQVVSPANFNAPGQVVIAGHRDAVARAVEAAKARGARRAVVLGVSVPSHCGLMEDAVDHLRERLLHLDISPGEIPVFHNVDGRTREEPDEVRQALVQQLCEPVRWTDCIRAISAIGVTEFIEMGPGKVLTGLMGRIDRGLGAAACHDPDSMRAALARIATEEDR